METEEKDAQKDYEEFIKDSAVRRADDVKALEDKNGQLADSEVALAKCRSEHKKKESELMANEKYMHSLHAECDWLTQNFGVRKEARSGEIDALTNAKAVLS